LLEILRNHKPAAGNLLRTISRREEAAENTRKIFTSRLKYDSIRVKEVNNGK